MINNNYIIIERSSVKNEMNTEYDISFDYGKISVRSFVWHGDTTTVWKSDNYYVSHVLSSPYREGWARYLDSDMSIPEPLGRLLLFPAGREIQSGGGAGSHRSISCVFSPEIFEDVLPQSALTDWTLARCLHLRMPQIETIMVKIYQELVQDDFGAPIMIESLTQMIPVLIARQIGQSDDARTRFCGGLAPWRMRRIHERLSESLPPPNLGELADLCDMSVRHFCRAFKAETGTAPAQYMRNAMIARANVLLANSTTSVGEIATQLGFASTANFSAAFRRATGVRPSDVTRMSRNR